MPLNRIVRLLARTFAPLGVALLVLLLAQPARGDADGGAPAADAAPATESGGLDAPVAPIAPPELVTPPELSSASIAKPEPVLVSTAPADVEPPRPITRKLWFWIAVSCVIVAATGVVMAVQNPSTTRPDCPAGYVCPR